MEQKKGISKVVSFVLRFISVLFLLMIFCDLSIKAWIKYESEPIATQITYRYGDDDKGGQFKSNVNFQRFFSFKKIFFMSQNTFPVVLMSVWSK